MNLTTCGIRRAIRGRRGARWTVALVVLLSGCVKGISSAPADSVSNDEALATLGYLWSGVRSAIEAKREPSTASFSLPLAIAIPCTRGGQGSYQGTLAGTKANGSGSATLAMTGSLAACQFDDKVTVTELSTSNLIVSGTIAIVNDLWGAMNVHMVAVSVTVNGKTCPGGVDVVLTGTSPSAVPISTGSVCGRTGAVPVP